MSGTLLLNPEEAANALRISRSAIFKLIHDGTISSIKIGRSRRIVAAELERYVKSLESDSVNTD